MDFYLLLILLITLFGIKFFIKDFNSDYLCKKQTNSLKGILILLIFYSHFISYIDKPILYNHYILHLRDWLGQFIIVIFLFYSGYGIYESIKKDKNNYLNNFPVRRILRTFFHFAIAVAIFFIIKCCFMGYTYNIKKILLTFIGWNSIGNSNWYVFDILILYSLFYISFKFFDKDDKKAIVLLWGLSFVLILWLRNVQPFRFYDTILSFPLGVTYSFYKDKIHEFIFNNKKYLLLLFVVLFGIFSLKICPRDTIGYWISGMLFSILCVLISMKIKIGNKVLNWLGENIFYIYIFQRLPMMYFEYTGFIKNTYLSFGLSLVITLLLTFIFKYIFEYLDKILFKINESKLRVAL